MATLDDKRLRLLHAIGRAEHAERFPLVRELAQELGYSGESSIRRLVDELVNTGYLHSDGGGRERQRRILRLTDKATPLLTIEPVRDGIPVLGTIPAGPLGEAVQQCGEFVNPGDGLRVQPGDFFLRVKGKSMAGDGILPGDLVLLRPGVQANNGEVAAVQIARSGRYEATLKHVHFQPGKRTVRLRASNVAYGEKILDATEVNVVGVYRGLLRRFEK